MMRVIDPAALDEQHVSVLVLPQHLYGGPGHVRQRRLVQLRFVGAVVGHMAVGEQTLKFGQTKR